VACHPLSADRAFAPLWIRSNLPSADARRLPALGSLRGIALGAWFGLAAQLGGWNSVAQLPMLFHVAVSTYGDQVIEGVVALLASLVLVVDLQILQRAALLTSPPVSVQDPLHQAPVDLLPKFDPLYLPLHSALPECHP